MQAAQCLWKQYHVRSGESFKLFPPLWFEILFLVRELLLDLSCLSVG